MAEKMALEVDLINTEKEKGLVKDPGRGMPFHPFETNHEQTN
ncbi:hypothetical protein [Algoriphagus sp. CAU 1675]|nr:hypothetical protein [Algoriphagus sp. CAU 1675]MDF2156887.1 hypothetical protein [Algoriphagus sp. CAU 1675]